MKIGSCKKIPRLCHLKSFINILLIVEYCTYSKKQLKKSSTKVFSTISFYIYTKFKWNEEVKGQRH